MSLSANASSPIPASSAPLLQAEGVTVRFDACERPFDVVRDVSFTLHPGRTLCLVGESGCGKSMTALSLLRLIPEPGRLAAGRILFEGRDLAELSESAMERVRGRDIGMIFQEPMTSLNPVIRVGEQVAEPLMRHLRLPKKAALAEAVELFRLVGIPAPDMRVRDYPHQPFRRYAQRVMIAWRWPCKPAPPARRRARPTALDVTIQGQILALLGDLSRERGMGLLLITHDLGVVAEMADEVGVMYAGRIVERAPCGLCSPNRAIPILGALSAPRPRSTRPLRRSWTPSPAQSPRPAISRRDAPSGRAARKRTSAVSRRRPSSNPPGPTAPGKSAAGLPKQGKCCRIRVQSYIECWQMRHGDGASPNMIIKELA